MNFFLSKCLAGCSAAGQCFTETNQAACDRHLVDIQYVLDKFSNEGQLAVDFYRAKKKNTKIKQNHHGKHENNPEAGGTTNRKNIKIVTRWEPKPSPGEKKIERNEAKLLGKQSE